MIKRIQKRPFDFDEDEKETLDMLEEFEATVVAVHDGDTILIQVDFWDFTVPFRFININAPELSEKGGDEARDYLKSQVLGKEVTIILGKKKIEKWGRMLGEVMADGIMMNEDMVNMQHATPFDRRNDGKIEEEDKAFEEGRIAKDFKLE